MKKKGRTSVSVSRINLMKKEVESNKRIQSNILNQIRQMRIAPMILLVPSARYSIRKTVSKMRNKSNPYCSRSRMFTGFVKYLNHLKLPFSFYCLN